jgi:hypothetical protein
VEDCSATTPQKSVDGIAMAEIENDDIAAANQILMFRAHFLETGA